MQKLIAKIYHVWLVIAVFFFGNRNFHDSRSGSVCVMCVASVLCIQKYNDSFLNCFDCPYLFFIQ